MALVVWQAGGRATPGALFLATLGAVAWIGPIATFGLSLNLFGFDGLGARRYFLLPVPPAVVLRAVSLTVLLPGAVIVAGVVLAWTVWSPTEASAMRLVMLA